MSNYSDPLPVIDILKNVVTLNNFLTAIDKIELPDQITSNPQYASFVSNFSNWRALLWVEFNGGLLDRCITPAATITTTYFKLKIEDQDTYREVFYGDHDNSLIPLTVKSADGLSVLVSNGEKYIDNLNDIAKSIEGADAAKVLELSKEVDALETQFSQQEAKLTDKAISSAKDVTAAAIDVAIALGSEGDVIKPLVSGITTLGDDAVTELVATAEISATLSKLQTLWGELDDASIQLFRIQRVTKQLKAVVSKESEVFDALSNIVKDWSQVSNIVAHKSQWTEDNRESLQEWAARTANVVIETYTQKVNP